MIVFRREENNPSLDLLGRLPLDEHQLHIWQIPLSSHESPVFRQLLSEEERNRADQFLLERQRHRYSSCRGAVRTILGRYLDICPADLRILTHEHGKPFVSAEQNGKNLRFNISHSADKALLAVGIGHEVGVDLERIRAIRGLEGMVARCLVETETAGMRSRHPEERNQQFLRYWTHKEAFLKAHSLGIRVPLQQVVVELGASPRHRIVNQRQLAGQRPASTVFELSLGDLYVGAAAWTSMQPCEVWYHTWIDNFDSDDQIGGKVEDEQ